MNATPDKAEILNWLREENPQRLEELWRRAEATRRVHVGNEVHLRGLVEISNHCVRQCAYCGLRLGHRELDRYRMTAAEILGAARQAVEFGYGTVVLQAGEDVAITRDWMTCVIRQIKGLTPLAVTLSLGERTDDELVAWRAAGADRYLLRHETSNRALFDAIHPPLGNKPCDRIALLRRLKGIGYETGSGIMVGLPGQTYESVANDILLFRELDLDMIGIGPFIPHPATPLGSRMLSPGMGSEATLISAGLKAGDQRTDIVPAASAAFLADEKPLKRLAVAAHDSTGLKPGVNERADFDQIPNSELMVYKVVALTRLVRPDANIPATTALATINKHNGRELGLQRGANVFMPNLTPLKYRKLYEIYPAKACLSETSTTCNGCLSARIEMIGRKVGCGPGSRRRTHDKLLLHMQQKHALHL